MSHLWISIAPAALDEFGEFGPHPQFAGVQRMVSGTPDELRAAVVETLASYGATVDTIPPVTQHNGEQPMFRKADQEFTGLMLLTFPCTAQGVNVDVDGYEPTGE